MPSTPTAGTAARRIDELFLDLICGDPDLLAAEFDAIIGAQWPDSSHHQATGLVAAPSAGTLAAVQPAA